MNEDAAENKGYVMADKEDSDTDVADSGNVSPEIREGMLTYYLPDESDDHHVQQAEGHELVQDSPDIQGGKDKSLSTTPLAPQAWQLRLRLIQLLSRKRCLFKMPMSGEKQ